MISSAPYAAMEMCIRDRVSFARAVFVQPAAQGGFPMREYVLMTDSCCDLPDQMARELQPEVLPLTIHMDGQDYPSTLDGAAISNCLLYTSRCV